jgi:hypothetical protein
VFVLYALDFGQLYFIASKYFIGVLNNVSHIEHLSQRLQIEIQTSFLCNTCHKGYEDRHQAHLTNIISSTRTIYMLPKFADIFFHSADTKTSFEYNLTISNQTTTYSMLRKKSILGKTNCVHSLSSENVHFHLKHTYVCINILLEGWIV